MKNQQYKTQIYKFGFYGLLKNLKFFEPFLWLYFIINGLSLFQIGLLYSIREGIIYVFEIPSGVFADRFGKKNELILCFVFYILSFIGFYLSDAFYLFAIAMTLYGFGEAFRSGTHKAMIMQYLEHYDLKESKTQIYGLTRSYSNIGSAVSSIGGIILVLYSPELSYLFLVAILPYILDLVLILSYPNFLNEKVDQSFKWKAFIKENWNSVKYTFTTKELNLTILDSSMYQAIFKTLRDYIQPIILGIGITFILFSNLSMDENIKIYIGLIYFVAYFISIFASKNAYLLENRFGRQNIIELMWILMSVTIILLGVLINNFAFIVISFMAFYLFLNIRKPYLVNKIGLLSDQSKRASVLSIESQITSLFIIVIAPIAGYLADTFSIQVMLIAVGLFMMVVKLFMVIKKSA